MVDSMDQNIGRLLAALDELKATDDTLILFLSDNGASAEGGRSGFERGQPGAETGTIESQTSFGLSWANLSDTPFRRFKRFTHEGGIATPLIAHWPAGIAPTRHATIEKQRGHVIDLLPTILAATGWTDTGKPALNPNDGINLLPALRGDPLPARALYFEHEGNRAVIEQGFKLVAQHGGTWELYDLDQDRTETNDLAPTNPARVAELTKRWQAWADDAGVKPWPLRK